MSLPRLLRTSPATLLAAALLAACGDGAPGGGAIQALRAPAPPEEAVDPAMIDYHPDLQVDITAMRLHPSGLLWADDTVGTGDSLDVDMTAVVHYIGWLPDGTAFDTSRETGPFSFRVGAGEVIEAWDLGVIGMRPGGKRKLIIPPEMGYGAEGFSIIPPNAILVFEIELLETRP